jgi:hypothetical protein
MIRNRKGFSVVQILIAVILAVGVLVGGFIIIKSFSKSKEIAQETELKGTGGDLTEELSAPAPSFDFSVSPLKAINLSTFNINSNLGSTTFSNIKTDTKISYTGSTNLTTPTVTLTVPTTFNIEAPAIPTAPTNTNTSTNTNTGATGPDCSQFSAVPSCSYVGASGTSAYETCKQCYPNK